MEAALCVSGTALGAAVSALVAQLLRPQERVRSDPFSYACPQSDPHQARLHGRQLEQHEDCEPRRIHSVPPEDFSRRTSPEDPVNIKVVSQGFSMEDCKNHSALSKTQAKEKSPEEVLGDLQKGNARFWMGVAQRPEKNAFQRRALIMAQFPQVAILGCADSRVPVEIVFDQGLGDLFVVRVAGNCLDTATTASLQYAVCHLGVKVLLVLGHEGCGAIKAAALPTEIIEREPASLRKALLNLKEGLDVERLSGVHDPRARDREAVVTNVKSQLATLTKDETIMKKVHDKELMVVGGFYEISSGIVDFFHEITEVVDAPGSLKKPHAILQTKSAEGTMTVRPAPLNHCSSTTLEVENSVKGED